MARIDVEREVARVVKAVGGQVLDETLPAQRDFENADYAFPREQVVAELKRCEEIVHDEGFIARGSSLFQQFRAKWQREGRNDIPLLLGSTVRINVSDFPEEFQLAWSALLQERLVPTLRKANAQIKATRARLNMPQALGLLLFAIDGDIDVTLEGLLHVTDRLLRRNRYSCLNGFIFFSANYAIRLPGRPWIRPFLFAGKDDRPSVPMPFKVGLGSAWAQHVAQLGGPPVLLMGTHSEPELLLQRFRAVSNLS